MSTHRVAKNRTSRNWGTGPDARQVRQVAIALSQLAFALGEVCALASCARKALPFPLLGRDR